MAPSAALAPITPLGGSLTLLRGRKPDQRTEAAELRMELRSAGHEMRALGARIAYAILADRADIALHVAGRLQTLGHHYANPDDAA